MADSKGIRAGKAYVELYADGSKIPAGLKKFSARLKTWGKSLSSTGKHFALAGGLVTGAMGAMARSWAQSGDELTEMSERTGIAVESLSTLSYIAMQTGTDITSLEVGVRWMQKNLAAAASGGGKASAALAEIGLSITDLASLKPDEQFEKIGAAITAIQTPAARTAAAMKIFGRGGSMLIPAMAHSGELRARQKSVGGPMTAADVEAAHEASMAMNDVACAFGRLKNAIGAALADRMKGFAKWLTDFATSARDWVKEHEGLVFLALKAAAAIVGFGLAMKGLAYGLYAARAALLALKVAMIAYKAAAAAVVAANPMTLLALGAAAATVAIAACTKSGTEGLTGIAADAKLAGDAIFEALSRGDIPAVFGAICALIQAEWELAIGKIQYAWNRFADTIASAVYELGHDFLGLGSGEWVGTATQDLETYTKAEEKARKLLEDLKKPKPSGPPKAQFAEFHDYSGIQSGVKAAMAYAGEAKGTFNTTNMLALAAGGANDALLKATETVADNTREIADNTADDGMDE